MRRVMSVSRKRLLAACLATLALCTSARWVWAVKAAQQSAPLSRTAVQPLPDRLPPVTITAGDRGNTYHELESRARRVTTTFAEAIAVAERSADGNMKATLTDRAGREIASLRLHRIDRSTDALEYTSDGALPLRATRKPDLRPTLDWMNQQAYSLSQDHAAAAAPMEWQDTLMRPVGAAPRAVNDRITEMSIEWPDGTAAVTVKRHAPVENIVSRRPARGDVVIGRLMKQGVEVGYSAWYPREGLLAWWFPGLTEGYVDADRLKEIGGWSFTPDMAWINVQNFAFHEFHSLVASRGSVARQGWIDRLASFFVPSLAADEAGCDDLHWLDGSIFRPCCDTHDFCYAKYGCSYNTWWMWWSSWQCDTCNAFVVWCFATGGGTNHILYRAP